MPTDGATAPLWGWTPGYAHPCQEWRSPQGSRGRQAGGAVHLPKSRAPAHPSPMSPLCTLTPCRARRLQGLSGSSLQSRRGVANGSQVFFSNHRPLTQSSHRAGDNDVAAGRGPLGAGAYLLPHSAPEVAPQYPQEEAPCMGPWAGLESRPGQAPTSPGLSCPLSRGQSHVPCGAAGTGTSRGPRPHPPLLGCTQRTPDPPTGPGCPPSTPHTLPLPPGPAWLLSDRWISLLSK